MTRKRDAAQNEAAGAVKRARASGAAASPNSSSRFQVDCSDNDNSVPGRRSFGGFNAVVEKYYSEALGLSPPVAIEKTERAVTDPYESLVGLPRGPNQVCHFARPVLALNITDVERAMSSLCRGVRLTVAVRRAQV